MIYILNRAKNYYSLSERVHVHANQRLVSDSPTSTARSRKKLPLYEREEGLDLEWNYHIISYMIIKLNAMRV